MKLHIGCGERYLPGYKHYDGRNVGEHIDYVGEADDLSMFEDNSLEEIYACHLLEHFGRHDVDRVLKIWYTKIMGGGGILRIAVPDFASIIKAYEKFHDMEKIMGLLYGGQNYEYNYHHVGFDFNYLKQKLENIGFTDIKRYDWKEFLPEGYDDFSRAYLPHMDIENGILMSLNIIAKKI